MPYAPLLDPEAVQQRLAELDDWDLEGDRIQKRFRFGAFMESIAFINRVAGLAEAADHHPDLAINFTRVTVSLITYASKGLTHKDFDLAAQIDGVSSATG
jgi:4a-hydroxytetrahydrobiopterin dehydratase